MIAVSRGVRHTLAERPGAPGDIAVIPNVVVAPERPPEPPTPADGTVSLLTTGAFRAYKNYSCAIEALRHLPPAFQLTMVGDGRQFPALSRRAAELGVADRVAFLGRVDDVSAYLRRSHALVHPSLSETFGFSWWKPQITGFRWRRCPSAASTSSFPPTCPASWPVSSRRRLWPLRYRRWPTTACPATTSRARGSVGV